MKKITNIKEVKEEISKVTGIEDDEILSKVIKIAQKYKETRISNLKDDIGTFYKIAKIIFYIIEASGYGSNKTLNSDYIRLVNIYKKYEKILKSKLGKDYNVKSAIWTEYDHLDSVNSYIRDNYLNGVIDNENLTLGEINKLNVLAGTDSPNIPNDISKLLSSVENQIIDIVSNNPNNYSDALRGLVYVPDYYILDRNDFNQITLNGLTITKRKPQAGSVTDKIVDTLFENKDSKKAFSINIKTSRNFLNYFHDIGLDKEFREVFLIGSNISSNKIKFRTKVDRLEVKNQEILNKFNGLLKNNNIPETRYEEITALDEPLDLSDIPF